MTQEEQQLIDFLEAIDPQRPMIVVRWVDEPRIVPESTSGFTVGRRAFVVLTARHKDGQTKRETIDALTLPQVKRIVAGYPIRALYRSDNQNR